MPVTISRAILLVFVGGTVGALLRELCVLCFPMSGRGEFALGVLTANLLACLLLGAVDALWVRGRVTPGAHSFLTTGLAGGLSTFSSLLYGPLTAVANGGSLAIAALYLFGSLLAGLIAIMLGQALGARMSTRVERD